MPHRKHLPAIAAVILCLSLSSCTTYSCGTPSGGHCYGTVSWGKGDLGETDLRAFLTNVTPVELNKGNLVINNELWLTQEPTSNCAGGSCWTEVGVTSGACASGSDTRYFWAENVVTAVGPSYLCRDLGAVDPQEFGQPTMLLIARESASVFDVMVETCTRYGSGPPPTCARRVLSAQSGLNLMQPNVATIGMEVGGSSGASAPQATFTGNWHSDPFFAGAWVNSPGSQRVETPVKASWTVNPTVQTEGGTWVTSCCQ